MAAAAQPITWRPELVQTHSELMGASWRTAGGWRASKMVRWKGVGSPAHPPATASRCQHPNPFQVDGETLRIDGLENKEQAAVAVDLLSIWCEQG